MPCSRSTLRLLRCRTHDGARCVNMQKKSHDWILRVDSTGQENNKYADTHNAIWQFVKNMPLVPEIAYRLRSETTCASTTQFVEFAMRKCTTCVCVGHGRSYRYGRYGPRRALAFTTNDQALHASAHDQALLRTTPAPLPWVPGTKPKPMKTSQA